jgi:hypothetical protein
MRAKAGTYPGTTSGDVSFPEVEIGLLSASAPLTLLGADDADAAYRAQKSAVTTRAGAMEMDGAR